jgi:uncharacterized phiE125 gp8 family phage protein
MPIPVSLEDARRQVKLEEDDTSQDLELRGFISDAAAWVERYTGHILVAREVTEQFRDFKAVQLRAWPIKPAAAVGVAYAGEDGEPVALLGARLDVSSRPAKVSPPQAFWPFRDTRQLFTVTVRAGYEAEDAVPGNFRRAMLVLIGAYDADREGGDVLAKAEVAARSLCRSFKLQRL